MAAYFLRRLLLMIPTFVGITCVVFAITWIVPGGPIEQALASAQAAAAEGGAGAASDMGVGGQIPPEVLAEMEKRYGYDKPFPLAYAAWLGDTVTLDLGTSYKYNEPVLDVIKSRFRVSIYFGLIGFSLGYLVCIPLGVMKAIKHGTAFDFASSAIVFVGYSIPGWALATLLLVYFGGGSFYDLVPLGGFRSREWESMWQQGEYWWCIKDQVHHTLVPVLAYAMGSFATLTVLMKNSLMENLGADYVRTAYAKGLSEKRVLFVHALRNSLIPICTGLGHALGILMAGSFLIEVACNINGIGYLGYTSVVERDYGTVMGILVINTLLVLVGNILSDVLYVIVDPRIRFS